MGGNLGYETTVVVAATADVVYDYVGDLTRHTEWSHQPTRMVSLTEGPIRVGSQFQTYEQLPSNLSFGRKAMFSVMLPMMKLMYGAKDYTMAEITALEPNTRVAWKAWAPSTKRGDLMRMNWEIRLEPNGDGTEVEQRCEIAPPPESPVARMVDEGMATQGRDEATANLNRLKSIIEGR